MSSSDFNYLRQSRLSQGEIAQPGTATLDPHSQGHRSSSSTPNYQQPPTANVSYPADYHRQAYVQNCPLDSPSSSGYSNQWYDNMPVSTTSRQALVTGAVGNMEDVTGGQDTTSQRNAGVLSYDTSALGSLAYASGLQYSEAESGRVPQDGTNVPSTREYGSINQSAHSQQSQTQYRSPILNLATAAADVASGHQQSRANSANSSNRHSVSYSHRSPPTPSESVSPITNTSYSQTLNTAQVLAHSAITYYRPNMGNTSSVESRDTSNMLSTVPGAYQPNQKQQTYHYGYAHIQNHTNSQSPTQTQAHAQVHSDSHAQNQIQAPSTQTGQASERYGATPPAITHTQRQSTAQTYHQVKTSNEQTKSVPSPANQNLHAPRQAPQSNTGSLQSQQQHDRMPAHSSNNSQTPGSSSQVPHQDQPPSLTAQGQPNHQISNLESSKVVAPTPYTQHHQHIDGRASSSPTQDNAARHAESTSSNTPATVNPSHVYNPYHEYRIHTEAAEAEQAKQTVLETGVADASISQLQQELQHCVADARGPDQGNNLGAQNTIDDPSGNPVNDMGEVRAPETANEKETEEAKRKQVVEKMLQLMREDPTLFDHAMEEVKNASPYTATPSQKEQQLATYPTPSKDSLSRPPGKAAKKANAPAKPHARNTRVVKSELMQEAQAGPSGAETPTSNAILAPEPHSQLSGSPFPPPGSTPQSSGPAHPPLSRHTAHQAPATQHSGSRQPQQPGSILPQSMLSQLSGSMIAQHSGYSQPQRPKATLTPSSGSTQGSPFRPAPAQSFQHAHTQPPWASAGSPQTLPAKAASIWPEPKKEALGINAVRFLSSIPENSNKVVTRQQICAILDRNPNYVELCETIEEMGFRLDRVRFAKALLTAVPDSHPTGPPQSKESPSANNSKGSVQNSTEIPPSAIDNGRDQRKAQVSMATSDLNAIIRNNDVAHPPPGSATAPPQPHVLDSGTPTPVDKPAKRGRGRPRKDKSLTQSKMAATSEQQLRNGDGNPILNAIQNGFGNAQSSAGSQTKETRQGNHDDGNSRPSSPGDSHHMTVHFTPLNGLRTQKEPESADRKKTGAPTADHASEPESGPVPHQPPQRHEQRGHEQQDQQAAVVETASGTETVRGHIEDQSRSMKGESSTSLIDKAVSISASLSDHGRGRGSLRAALNASLPQPAKISDFSPSTLLTPPSPSLLTPKEASHLRPFSLADIEQLSQDPYDLEPELPDHLVYLERCRRADHDQSQATAVPATDGDSATIKAGSMGLPLRADSAASTPKSTTPFQSRISRKNARLESAFRVRRHHQDRVEKNSAYNPKKISRDVLIATGKHPATRPLNAHIERIKHKANYVQKRPKLSAVYWAAVDPGIPTQGAANGAESTEKMDVSGGDVPNVLRRTLQRLSKNDEAARRGEQINGSAGAPRTEGAKPIPGRVGPLKRKSRGRMLSSSSSSNGAVLGPLKNGTPSSSGKTEQQSRPSPVDALRASVAGNFERRGLVTTPARPSKLRNEIAPSTPASRPTSTPSVVIPSRSPSARAEYTPFATDQTANVFMAKTPAYDPGPSGHMVFKCEWLDCDAELHNFAALRKHVTMVHRSKGAHALYQCRWRGCGKVISYYDEKGKSSLIKKPINFQYVTSLDFHMEQEHLALIRHTLGLGPRAGPEDGYGSGISEKYLTDVEGRRLMPLSSFTNWRDKNVTESTASPPAGTESRRLPALLTGKRPADADLSLKMKAKRIAATAAYEKVLKHYQTAGPTVLVPPSCTFDQNENRRATLKSEDLYMVVRGPYDPIQMILDKGKIGQNKSSGQVEEDQDTIPDQMEEEGGERDGAR